MSRLRRGLPYGWWRHPAVEGLVVVSLTVATVALGTVILAAWWIR